MAMQVMNNKTEIYIPLQYINENEEVVDIPDSDKHILHIQEMLLSNDTISGFSIRNEKGVYKARNGRINSMDNKIIYFYSENALESKVEEIVKYIMEEMKQESVLVVRNNKALLKDAESFRA